MPFTVGQSRASDLWGHQMAILRHPVVVTRNPLLPFWRRFHPSHFGRQLGSEPGTAILGTFTFKNTTTAPFDQLTLNDVQNYTQPINFGISSYELGQWLITGFVQDSVPRPSRSSRLIWDCAMTVQTLTTATKNFEPRIGFAWHPTGDSRYVHSRRHTLMYYTHD